MIDNRVSFSEMVSAMNNFAKNMPPLSEDHIGLIMLNPSLNLFDKIKLAKKIKKTIKKGIKKEGNQA